MRYLILSGLFFFIISYGKLNAQIKLGLLSGLNGVNIYGTSLSGKFQPEPVLRYYGGLYLDVPVKDQFALESNVMYSLKGWKFISFLPEHNGTMNLHYLTLQVLPKYQVASKFAVKMGVEGGYMFKSRREPRIVIFDDYYREWDFSAVLGVEYRIIDPLKVTIQFVQGLSKLRQKNTHSQDEDGVRFSTLQFGLAYDLFRFE